MKNSTQYHLILHNDNKTTLNYAIETIQYICNHPFQQCLQIALIASMKGECSVKIGTNFDSLIEYRDKFVELGLGVHIQARPKINTYDTN